MTAITPLKNIISPNIIDTANPSELSKKKITIFLVDDNELYLKALKAQFTQNPDLLIRTFITGESCLMHISEKKDVIVLDYLMSDDGEAINGLNTLLLIKNTFPETQVIISSSNEDPELAVTCVKEGAFDYIVKDSNTFEKLKASIKKIFGRFSKEKEIIVWDW
jgi:two-component system, OmpR family, response regulator